MREDRIPTMPQASERIPTMPQASERIPTMPQASERIPTVPQALERIPTMPQNDGRVPTVPQTDGRIATVPQGGTTVENNSGRLIGADCSFVGEGGARCRIHADQMISEDSGESQIYGCTLENSTERYVARVLKSVTPRSKVDKLMQREKVIRFLLQNSRDPQTHILPLIDHGTVEQAGMTCFVEVYPFCEGGDLGSRKGTIPYRTLCEEVIPAVNKALRTFHQAGFVHRDVKPDNLYYYNGRVVLGDFGITCELVNDSFAIDTDKTGTLGYYAPELMSQAAVKASDYYSFGQTLWTLYSGEMMYQNILRRYRSEGTETQRIQVNMAMLNNTYFGLEQIRQGEHAFEILIRGLLQYDVASRFNYEQVERWLDGDLSLAHEITKYHDMDTYPVYLLVDGVKCWNHEQLSECLKNNWEGAKELLYSGDLWSFFQHINPMLCHEIDQITRVYSRAPKDRSISRDTMNDIGLARLLLRLTKGKKLVWGDVVYEHISDLASPPVPMANLRWRYGASEEGFLRSGLVADWYVQWQENNAQKPDDYVLKALTAAQEYVAEKSWDTCGIAVEVSRSIIRQVFGAMNGHSGFEDCKNVEELASSLSARTEKVYGYMTDGLLRNPRFYGFLYAQGFADFADKLLRGTGSDMEQMELLFSFLEQQTEGGADRKKLVDFYIKHGPHAYMLWFRDHLDLYQFNGQTAGALRSEIVNCRIGGETIEQVRECYDSMRELVARFKELFQNNLYKAYLGLTEGKERDGVTSSHLFAYWHKSFLGHSVPIGFDIS